MTSRGSPVQPPRAAAWFVELFASPQEADGLLGDLAEEFSAVMARDGETEALRHYRRHAWHTVRDLAVVQWRTRPRWSAAIATTGLILVTGIGPGGIFVTGPISLAARTLVARYPVYDYVAPSVFSEIVLFLPSLLIGFLIALLARTIDFRSMSAALVFVVAIAILERCRHADCDVAAWSALPCAHDARSPGRALGARCSAVRRRGDDRCGCRPIVQRETALRIVTGGTAPSSLRRGSAPATCDVNQLLEIESVDVGGDAFPPGFGDCQSR